VKNWTLAATILGSSMAFIDGSVVNVALPAIQDALTASVREAQWIANAYTLLLGALILAGGAAGDRFGRRRVFIWGAAIFTAASVVCGLAPGATILIAARAVQGIGGALLVPSSLALISAAFPPEERGRAIGTWAGASALTTALGPVLGGWLVDVWSWRAIFFINVPIALAAILLALRGVAESHAEEDGTQMDWRGVILITAALVCLVYGLTAASDLGSTERHLIVPLSASAIAFVAFLWGEAHSSAPMVPLHLFRSRAFSGTNTMTLLMYFALAGTFFFLPFDLIRTQGYSSLIAGAAFLPFTIVMGGLSRWSGAFADRYGARLALILGPLITAAGYLLLAVPGIGGSFWYNFFPPMLVLGLGMAVSVAPLTTTVMGAVADRYAGVASGINNAVARIAGALAVALLGTLATHVFGTALDERLRAIPLSPAQVMDVRAQISKLAEAEVPPQIPSLERAEVDRAFKESFVASFRVTMGLAAGLALASALCAALTVTPRSAGRT
jgi:EmrB/QacA subfamily drug resistance transporter